MSEEHDAIAALIRAAGKRTRPDAGVMARVRAAVEDEWRATVRRRRVTRWSIAAVAVAATVACVLLLLPRRDSVLQTAAAARALDWNGNTLRLDANTRVAFVADDIVRLERGTLYFSSEGRSRPVTIVTPFGDVHDIGTRFETRLSENDVQVRVDEGRAELRGEIAAAGERLIATRERVTRIAPPIRLERMRLEEVVARVAREKRLTPEWRTPPSMRTIVLHGDVAFTPDEALDAATAAAGATWRVSGRQLVIEVRP